MEGLILGIIIGLLLGWWFLPQPEFVKRLYVWLKTKIGGSTPEPVLVPEPTPVVTPVDTTDPPA